MQVLSPVSSFVRFVPRCLIFFTLKFFIHLNSFPLKLKYFQLKLKYTANIINPIKILNLTYVL